MQFGKKLKEDYELILSHLNNGIKHQLTSTSAVRVSFSRCFASGPILILIPCLMKSLSLNVGNDLSNSLSDASRSTVDPLRSNFLDAQQKKNPFEHHNKLQIVAYRNLTDEL